LTDLSIKVPRGAQVNLFHQPRLESGFPDVVLVVWNPRIAKNWPKTRKLLTSLDLRVLHFICSASALEALALKPLFGVDCQRSLQRLQDADAISVTGGVVKARRMGEIFAVKRIIALEAKMQDWQGALNQAVLNTWFSNESWMLMPERITRRIASECSSYQGVRCLSPVDVTHDFSQHNEMTPPVSYASWLFNEWAWRLAGSD